MKRKARLTIGLIAVVLPVVVIVLMNSRGMSYPFETGSHVRAQFVDQLNDGQQVTFRSHGGKWIGTDNDIDLRFIDGSSVEMIQYGYGITRFGGTYTMSESGVIGVEFPYDPVEWPQMIVGKDEQSLLLSLMDDEANVRNGRLKSPEFWPFRPVESSEY